MRSSIATMAGVFLFAFLAQGQEAPVEDAKATKTEVERLRKIIMEEQQVIADCMKRIDGLEKDKTTMDKGGLDKIKIGGDFRYRFESIKQDPDTFFPGWRIPGLVPVKDAESRERHRLRLRLNLSWKINDELNIITQLATTEGNDPISTNQTLTGGFNKKNLYIDMLYADYHPLTLSGLNVYAGKMKNPFYTPGKTQLIWDSDLTPEGLATTYTKRLPGTPWEFSAAGGYFIVQENERDFDSQLLGLQGSAKYLFNDEGTASAMLGASYYDYINAKGYRTFVDNSKNFGNSLNLYLLAATTAEPLGFYADDYQLAELFGEVTVPIGKIPLTLFGDYVINTSADDTMFDTDKGDTGWALGLSLGKCVAPKSWALRYEYRNVERNAVVGAFSDSDFGGGGTNASGHILGAEYMLMSNVKLGATYFYNELEGSDWLRQLNVWGGREKIDGPYQRFQLDFNVKF